MSYGESLLFRPGNFGNLSLRNRVVMAPMTRRKAEEDGIVTEPSAAYYRRRAAGEVGLIVSEGVAIDSKHAYDTRTVPRIETEEQIRAWKRVVDAVHEAGGAFAPQLWHTGPKAERPIGPSAGPAKPRKDGTERPPVRAMESEDFQQVREAFVQAAKRCREIGCDALEIHGAHGYLLDAFLSEATNQRTDEYGGSVENRMRFPLEVVRGIRGTVGKDYPVIYRFSQWKTDDYGERKWRNPDELGAWVNTLEDAGVDILHVSTRRATDTAFDGHGERTLAGWTKALSGLPTIAVGSVSVTLPMDEAYGEARSMPADPGEAIRLIDQGEADMLAVGRALIPNPDWVKVVRDGDWRELNPFDKSQLERLV